MAAINVPRISAFLRGRWRGKVQQRTTVGIVGLLIALYSGVNWMGNLREAIRAQSRDVWERRPQDQEKIWVKYLREIEMASPMPRQAGFSHSM